MSVRSGFGRADSLGLVALVAVALVASVACGSSRVSAPPSDSRAGSAVTTPAEDEPKSELACPRATGFDAAAIAPEASCLLAHYIRLETTNPPGNEIVAARFLRDVLARDGIEAQIIESAPGRANLMARRRSTSSVSVARCVWSDARAHGRWPCSSAMG